MSREDDARQYLDDELEHARVLKDIKQQGRNPSEQSRLSVLIPLSMHHHLKSRALRRGKTIRQYLMSILEKEGMK